MIPRRTLLTGAPLALAHAAPSKERLLRTDRAAAALAAARLSHRRRARHARSGTFVGPLGVLHHSRTIRRARCNSFTPTTGEPMAALATHYEVSADGLKYTIFLRGHPKRRGVRLAATGDLAPEFSRGRGVPPHATPALWSDGSQIVAGDVVDSWQRALDPATAATYSYLLHCVVNAEQISDRKMHPNELAVRAVDPFQLRIALRAETPFLLQALSHRVCCVTPRQAIERYGPSSTDPARIVTNGAFILKERRTNDRVLLVRESSLLRSGCSRA